MNKVIYFLVTNDLVRDQRMHRICSTLAQDQFSVYLIGRKKQHSVDFDDKRFHSHRINCIFTKGKLFYLEYNIRLIVFLLFKSFDGICAVDNDTVLAAGILTILRRKRLIFDAHEIFTGVPELQNKPLSRFLWDLVLKIFLPFSHLRYTVNTSLANYHAEKYNYRFEVIRNVPQAADLNFSSIEHNWNSKILFYQGVLNQGRGLEELIKAMELLPEFELFLAGDGDLESNLKKQAAITSYSDRITFTGLLKPDDLNNLTSNAFIGFNLLDGSSSNYYYSLANKFFDYVRAGIPQISMHFPEYVAYNKEYEVGFLIPEIDISLIAETVLNFKDELNLYSYYCQQARKAAKVWTWEHESKKLSKMYTDLFLSD